MFLGFDPGRDKCGLAIVNHEQEILAHQVVESHQAIATINALISEYEPELIVMGNQTTSKVWKKELTTNLTNPIPIYLIDERNSSLEARDRYWEMYPPQGLIRLLPQGLRTPPRPIDDIVAIILIERYLKKNSFNLS
jgi:RNase H-fold protein (predicted Holliday junction resolvase)